MRTKGQGHVEAYWLDGPCEVAGMFVEFMEEMKGVKQVPMSSVN